MTGLLTSGSPFVREQARCDIRKQPGCGDVCYRPPGFVGYAEGLHWRTNRRGLDYAAFLDPVWLTPTELHSPQYGWDTGLRAGLGYRFASGWDVTWNYTYFSTETSASITSEDSPGQVLIATRSQLDLGSTESVFAANSLKLNLHDLEIGRSFELNPSTALRVFGGFRWGMIDQAAEHNFEYLDLSQQTVDGSIAERNDMNAYGIRMGVQANWISHSRLSLFGRLAGSVLVGDFTVYQHEHNSVYGTILDFPRTQTEAVPVLECAAGLAWRSGGFEVQGGYEMSTWFNMAEIDRSSHDLVFDGLFFRVGYSR